MKKTPNEPDIRPPTRIHIPSQLATSTRKSMKQHNFFSNLQEPPLIMKKQLLFQAMGIEVKGKDKERKSAADSRRTIMERPQPRKDVQIKIVKEFQALSEDKIVHKTISTQRFKIKMSGAGFRKRGKSLASLRIFKKQSTKSVSKPATTSQQYFKVAKCEEDADQLDIIKAYYSAKIGNQALEKIPAEETQKIEEFQYRSEFVRSRPERQLTIQIKNQKSEEKLQQKIMNNVRRVSIDEDKNELIVRNIVQEALEKADFEQAEDDGRYEDNFARRGFGVTHDLSKYDIDTLADMNGTKFLQKHLNQPAECPYFEGQKYKWTKVIVVGYDQKTGKAIIRRQKQKESRLVSRLSLKFSKDPKYWERINEAKCLRDTILQEIKYTGYIDHRPQTTDIFQMVPKQTLAQFPTQKITQIQNECHNRYYKNFLIFSQMFSKPQKFIALGLRTRSFVPFKQAHVYSRYTQFSHSKQLLQKFHYCSVTNLAYTIKTMINKILLQTQHSFFHKIIQKNECVSLEKFTTVCKKAIKEHIGKLVKQTREVLASEIIYQMRYSFGAEERPVLKVVKGNDKQLQKKYFRLCNIIFRDLVSTHYFQQNCEALSSYLLRFAKFTPDRPQPILHISIMVNESTKQLQCVPNLQECVQKLEEVFKVMESSVCEVADLTSDLLYEKERLIKVKLKEYVAVRVRECFAYSFEAIDTYIQAHKKYLRYLTNIPFTRQSFHKETLTTYSQILSQITADNKSILHYHLSSCGLFRISLQQCKNALSQAIMHNRNRIMRTIEKQIIEENGNMMKQLMKMNDQMKNVPDEQVTYVKMKKYVHVDCENILEDCKNGYGLCGDFYQLLEEYSYVLKEKEFQKYIESVAQIVKIQKRVIAKKYELHEIQRKLIERINQEREQIQKVIENAKVNIEDIINFKKLDEYKQNFAATSKLYFQLDQNCKKLQNINYRQQLLLQQLSVFPWLTRLLRKLQPFFEMWKNIYYYMIQSQDWYELPIQELNFQDIKHKVNEIYKKQFVRLSKYFNDTKNIDAFMICEAGGELVKKIEEKFWIIDSFTKQGLLKKPNMMSSILGTIYGPDAPDNFRNVNLHDLINHNVEKDRQFVEKTSNRAQKIWNLEKRVNAVIVQVKTNFFQIGQKYGISYLEHDHLLALTMSTRQQLHLMDVIKSQDEAVDIHKRITNVYNKIQTIENSLLTINRFEAKFIKIYRVFLITEIINELADDKRKVNEVSRAWNTIVKHFHRDLQVWQAIDSDSHKNRLEICIKTLIEVEESLTKYLHTKRKIFPRLFFISDDQLIQLISDYKTPISPLLLQYLFNGAIRFLDKTHPQSKKISIIGLQGPYNDRILFKRPVNEDVIIWDKLKFVHEEIKEAMQVECGPFAIANSGILVVRMYHKVMKWTLKVEELLKKGEKQKTILIKFLESYLKDQLKQDAPKIRKGEIQKLYSWFTLRSVSIMLADILQNLIKTEQPMTSTSFQWQKCLRIYFQSQKLAIKTISITMPLNYEYIGCQNQDFIHLFASPIRNIHTVLALNRIFMGCNFYGQYDQETIKSLSILTMTHYVNIFVEKNYISMGQFADFLTGFYVEPILGCIMTKQGEQLPLELMSVLSEVAFEVRQALLVKEYISVLGTQTKWELSRGHFNFSLHINTPVGLNNRPDHHLMTLKLCFRQVRLRQISWTTFVRCMIQSIATDATTVQIISQTIADIMEMKHSHLKDNYKKCIIEFVSQEIHKCSYNEGELVGDGKLLLKGLMKKVGRYVSPKFQYQLGQKLKEVMEKHEREPDATQYKLVQIDEEVREFASLLDYSRQNSQNCSTIRMVTLVGPPLSGKTQLISSTLQYLGIQTEQHLHVASLQAYLTASPEPNPPKFLILQSLYSNSSYIDSHNQLIHNSHLLPPQCTVIYECRSLDRVGPSPITIFHKSSNNNWHKVMWKLLKEHLKGHSAVIEEFSRQMGILVRTVLYRLLGCSGKYHMADIWMWEKNTKPEDDSATNAPTQVWRIETILIKIVRNCFKTVHSLVLEGRIVETDLSSIREGVFLSLLWIARHQLESLIQIATEKQNLNKRAQITEGKLLQIRTPHQTLSIFIDAYMQQIQSSFLTRNNAQNTETIKKYKQVSSPYDYCYDIQKKTWLEWAVIDEVCFYFQKNYDSYDRIYLPVKETVSALYYCQYLGKHWDFWLMAQRGGSGSSTIVTKMIENRDKLAQKQIKPAEDAPKNQPRPKTQPPKTPKATQWLNLAQYLSLATSSSQLVTKMLEKLYTNRLKDGSFNPYKNGLVHVVVDDMSLPNQQKLMINKEELLKTITCLINMRTQPHNTHKLNKLRMALISSWTNLHQNSRQATNCYMDRIHSSVVPIYMRALSTQSQSTIYNYILEWFFENTDNPFSKEVRSMQALIVGLSVRLAATYPTIQSNRNKEQAVDRFVDVGIKNLMTIFGFLCQVNPRRIKKEREILQVWIYEFKSAYPHLSWVDYSHAFNNLHLKKPQIQEEEFLKTVQKIIPTQQGGQSDYYLLKVDRNNRLKQYNSYTYKQAQLAMVNSLLAELQHNPKKELEFISSLILSPSLMRQIMQSMKVFTSASLRSHLLKIDQPYSGSRTVLKCAQLVATGHMGMAVVEEGSLRGWRKDIIELLAKGFAAEQRGLACLTYQMRDTVTDGQFLQVMCEYLRNGHSETMLYQDAPSTNTNKDRDDQQDREPQTLMQSLNIHSCFSEKYSRFVEYCQKYMKIVAIMSPRVLAHTLAQIPNLVRFFPLIHHPQPPTSHTYQGIITHSLGPVWKGQPIAAYLQQNLQPSQHQKDIMKSVLQVEEVVNNFGIFLNRKYGLIQWLKCSIAYYRKGKKENEEMIGYLRTLLLKKKQIEEQKKKLEKELAQMLPKLAKVKSKNELILAEVNQQEQVYQSKKTTYEKESYLVSLQRAKTDTIRQECEEALGKVTPMLQSAEQSLQKVTRDDINQLRSFPNPPLSAVKVVQALCFVFNEDGLVKEKVENGNKFKDYWDYAKKFILNDRLLKRVTEFKPDYIKNLNRNKMEILKVIIRQPQFREEKVFKASSAAGNLSVWMRAVVLTFQVMEVIDPKRKLLNETLQALQQAEQVLQNMRLDMEDALAELKKRQDHYNKEMSIQRQIEQKIAQLTTIIKRSDQFLAMLSKMEDKWNHDIIVAIPSKIQKLKEEAIVLGLFIVYLCRLGFEARKDVRKRIEKMMKGVVGFNIMDCERFGHYSSIFLKMRERPSDKQGPNASNVGKQLKEAPQVQNKNEDQPKAPQQIPPAAQNPQIQPLIAQVNITSPYYCQNFISLLQKLKTTTDTLVVLDETETFCELLLQNSSYLQHRYMDRIRVIDCLALASQGHIYDKINEKGEEEEEEEQSSQSNNPRKELVIVLKLQQLTLCPSFLKFTQSPHPRCQFLLLFHHPPAAGLDFDITNQLCPQTKHQFVSSLISPIWSPSSQLHTKHQKYQHSTHVAHCYNQMTHLLLSSPNILLDDRALAQWRHNYDQYWTHKDIEVKVKNNGQIQREIVAMLADSHYWIDYCSFLQFVAIVAAACQRGGNNYTLNQTLQDKFEASGVRGQRGPIRKKTEQKNELRVSQAAEEQQELLPFTPITLIQVSSDPRDDIIFQFLQEKRQQRSKSLANLSSAEQVLYYPSQAGAMASLQYLMENQKEMVVCCKTRFQLYRLHQRIHQQYSRFCRAMEEADDDFLPQNFGFRAYILLIGDQGQLIRDRKWRVIKWTPQYTDKKEKSELKYFDKQLQKANSNLVKAEKLYCEEITKNESS